MCTGDQLNGIVKVNSGWVYIENEDQLDGKWNLGYSYMEEFLLTTFITK